MEYRQLGRTGIKVSAFCLGTMTYGTQTSEAEAHRQIDTTLDAGINFLDTAEMYPTTPLSPETAGRTEEIIGTWNAKGARDRIVIATKIVGDGYKGIRDGAAISGTTIRTAIEGSLRRLQTDCIDLYQLHWPNRGSYHFRKWWKYDPTGQDTAATLAHIEDVLRVLGALIEEGKIRAIGLSNESAWDTAQFLRIAEAHGLPRVATVQNEYSLLCRHYDMDLAELSHHEDVGLLAFSPLAAGILTGKYLDGAVPSGSRRSIKDDLGGRWTDRVDDPVRAYKAIAEKHGLDVAQMALAFCRMRPFMASVIFGATTQPQLEHALGAVDLVLDDAVLDEISAVYRQHPIPM